MLFGILTLITALAIAGVAAWFSIAGLMIFFGGMPLSIAIMAGTLEVGKLLTASWLYRYWSETSILLRTYLTTAVVVLMLITSAGIYGYLSKAASDVSSDGAVAFAEVERVDGLILRQENKIAIIEDRILSVGGSVDVSQSIEQQETIRDGAWERVQGDIDFANGQIQRLRDQLAVLDKAVNDLRNKGVEVITTEEGGIFQGDTKQTIDYVAQANDLYNQQESQRADIKTDIDKQQDNIDAYRVQAQDTINGANAEINRLRNTSSNQQDANIEKINAFNVDIDAIYNDIAVLKDTKFEAESKVRDLEREIGPIKYVAELLYGASDQSVMDKAVRIFILLFVFVFDPLAIMLLIAANQTLLRYGINLESTGPKDTPPKDDHYDYGIVTDNPSAVDDAAKAMAESASEKKRANEIKKALSSLQEKYKKTLKALDDKPKEIVIEKIVEVEVIKEVEKVVEREVPVHVEKIIEVEKPVEVEKEVVVTIEKEVPGPERIVEVPGPERIVRVESSEGVKRLNKEIVSLQNELQQIKSKDPEVVEKIVEKIIEKEVPVEVEKTASGDLKEAAHLMAISELNKEDLSEAQILEMLQKSSDDEVKRKLGFWAVQLPKTDVDKEPTNKKYIGKK
tara:strand:+ start:538 stop:2409 length:1872 start_codon:yes stop_codon:yes gene_type:complete